jgi:hypothetical protein
MRLPVGGWRMVSICERFEAGFENLKFLLADLWFAGTRSGDFDRLLPVLEGSFPSSQRIGTVLFAACDGVYFHEFARHLLASATTHSPGIDVHLHLYDPSSETLHLLNRWTQTSGGAITATWESLKSRAHNLRNSNYYATARFIRLYQLIKNTGRDFLAIDVDSLIRGPLDSVLQSFDCDISMHLRLKRPSFASKIKAGAVYCRATPSTLEFLHRLSSRLARHLQSRRLRWGIDQQCIYWTWRRFSAHENKLRLVHLPSLFLDWNFENSSLIWTGKGNRKHTLNHFTQFRKGVIENARVME